MVPGLLQTREYAEALINGALPEAPPSDVEKRVERPAPPPGPGQRRTEHPLRLWAVIDEAALRRVVGGKQS